MTPQERELIMKVVGRLQDAPAQAKDPEAEQLIVGQMSRQPDALYLLTQAVIVQEYGLQQAQERIDTLQQEVEQAQKAQTSGAPTGGGSFLGGMFGGPAKANTAQATPPAGRGPAKSSPSARQGQPGRSGGSAPGTMAGQPANTAATGANRGGMGDFMRNAAMMAVGVAGGHMLFNGLQGMFGDDSTADPAVADAGDAADTCAIGAAEPVAEDSGGWGADQGVSEEALAGDDPSLWEQPEPVGDGGWGSDDAVADGGMDGGGFDDGGGEVDFGGDDDWG